jgi:hypothetical protein
VYWLRLPAHAIEQRVNRRIDDRSAMPSVGQRSHVERADYLMAPKQRD